MLMLCITTTYPLTYLNYFCYSLGEFMNNPFKRRQKRHHLVVEEKFMKSNL